MSGSLDPVRQSGRHDWAAAAVRGGMTIIQAVMSDEREVWIVGDPGGTSPEDRPSVPRWRLLRARSTAEPRPGQEGSAVAAPEEYGPCLICGPGSRSLGGAAARSARHDDSPEDPSTGVQLGYTVDIEDVDTGKPSAVRLVSAQRQRQSGDITTTSPLGMALLGKEVGAVVEFNVPRGGQRKVRIVDSHAEGS